MFVKDQSSFYEFQNLAICINIKAFNLVNGKQLNVLKTFLEYLEFYIILLTENDSALKVAYQIAFRGLVAYKLVVFKKV